MKQIDLHLVSWMRPKMTELVIKTIHRNTKRENFRLVVLDNGSGIETQQMLRNLHENGLIDELLVFSKNMGLEPARQILLFEATYSPYFVCVDNDCLAEPIVDGEDWLERLVDLMKHHEDYAAIACRTQVMVGTGNIYEQADQNGEEVVEFPHPGGSLRLMKTEPTRQTRGWRERPGRGEEERHIGAKLRELGHKTGFATDIRTLHLFGTRGSTGTDNWGYDKEWMPRKSGHGIIYHPALEQGDNFEEVAIYAGEDLAKEYFNA